MSVRHCRTIPFAKDAIPKTEISLKTFSFLVEAKRRSEAAKISKRLRWRVREKKIGENREKQSNYIFENINKI